MPKVPNSPDDEGKVEKQENLQGYQDDFDTSKKDQIINEEVEDPSGELPATRSEFAQGLRDSSIPDQDGGDPEKDETSADSEPPLADPEDLREEIEDRDEDDQEKPMDSWLK